MDLSLLALLLAGVGLWFLLEGALYAAMPQAMRRFLDWAARLPERELRAGGLWTAILGAICLYAALRLI